MRSTRPQRVKGLLYLFGWALIAFSAQAADSASPGLGTITHQGLRYHVRFADPKKDDLELFLKDDQGHFLNHFSALEKYVASKGEKLLFACNAGMFQPDWTPVGLLVQNGQEVSPLNLNDGTGNFFMKPNGVFVINDKHEALIVDSGNYAGLLSPAVWATQSGPLLVHGGDVNPDFIDSSVNKKIRSGVGVRKDGMVVFVISAEPVNFYNFAEFFLDVEKCPDALFLDGEISAFHVPDMNQPSYSYGPMFGLVERE